MNGRKRRAIQSLEEIKNNKNYVISDRAFNHLYNDPNTKLVLIGNWNYRVRWVHDVFINKFVESEEYKNLELIASVQRNSDR